MWRCPNERSGGDGGTARLLCAVRQSPRPRLFTTSVRLESMRVFLVIALVSCGLMVGCAHRTPSSSPESAPTNESASIILDNHGGYSHAGRSVALQPDGSYIDTRYTDVIGDQKVERGTYTFDQDRTRLTLSPRQGGTQTLCRVYYRGQQYWVWEQDKQRVTNPADAWFRQISLRAEAR